MVATPPILQLSAEMADLIIEHAAAGLPEEVCGLISGRNGIARALYPGRNISPTPRVAYELDHETLARMLDFEDAGLDLVAIYHSHPNGPEEPSETDLALAFYPDACYVICSMIDPRRPSLRAFRFDRQRARFVAVLLVPLG